MLWVPEKTSAYEKGRWRLERVSKSKNEGRAVDANVYAWKFLAVGGASRCWQRFGVLESLRHERKRSVEPIPSAFHISSKTS